MEVVEVVSEERGVEAVEMVSGEGRVCCVSGVC